MIKLPSITDIGIIVAVFAAFGTALAQIPEAQWYWAPVASTVVLGAAKALQVWNEKRKIAPLVLPAPDFGQDPQPAALSAIETAENVEHMRKFSFWYNWLAN